MRSHTNGKVLALILSFSLIAGSALPAFAAEAGADPEQAAYEIEQTDEWDAEENAAPESDEDAAIAPEEGTGESSEADAVTDASESSDEENASPAYEEGAEDADGQDIEEGSEETDELEDAEEADAAVPESEEAAEEAEDAASDDPAEVPAPAVPLAAAQEAAYDEEDPDSGSCGASLTWKITTSDSTTTLTISGTGAMDSYTADNPAPWKAKMGQLTDLVIENGATSIGENAFVDAFSLKNAAIPSSVTSIAETAFSGVSGLTVKGNFKTAAETYAKAHSFQFVPAAVTAISGAAVTISPTSYTYDGSARTPSVSVVYSVTPLVNGRDYTVSYSNNTNAGTATVTVTGKGNFNGTAQKTFAIGKQSLAKAKIKGVKAKLPYIIGGVKPAPTVVLGSKTLKKGTDYTVKYTRYNKLGKATLTVTGKGNYSGSVKKKYTIVKASLKKAKIKKIPAKTYTGKAICPKPVIKMNGKKLKKGRDYTLKYANNKNFGKATITIKGKGKFKGIVKRTFKIQKASVADASVYGLQNKSYTGSPITQNLTVKLKKKKLAAGRDYKVSYLNNKAVGIATVKITGTGNYKGQRTLQFRIERASITRASLSGLKDQVYTGKAVKPEITVKLAGRRLVKGTDYTLKYQNNTEIGTARVIITGRGNYKDSITGEFSIKQPSVANASISVRDMTYTGNDIMPAVTVTLNGKVLSAGKDFSVRYSNNVEVGTAQVTVSGMGAYGGSRTVSFRILPPPVRLQSAQDTSGGIKIGWKSLGNSNFVYEIQCSSDRTFNSDVMKMTADGADSTYTIPGKTLSTSYIRIRTASKANRSICSDWHTWQ